MNEPALTAEEWARRRKESLVYSTHPGGPHVPLCMYVEIDGDGFLRVSSSYTNSIVAPRLRMAAAALALKGQPFGFTHDDPDLIRTLATALLEILPNVAELGDLVGMPPRAREVLTKSVEDIPRVKRWVEDLCGRIEALLPPRAPEVPT